MRAAHFRSLSIALTFACLHFAGAATAQTPAPSTAAVRAPGPVAQSPQSLEAEKEQIWNSADMLRARAWLKDYCSKSAKVTPEMAKQYEAELANMSPNQMRLWLMKFDEEEQQRQQQYAMFQQANQAMLNQAKAAHKQTQQAYNAINQASTQAAMNAQQQINEQRDVAQQAQLDKQVEQSGPYPYAPFYGGGYGGYGIPFGAGGVHYHYHMY
jgi:hypothetical protein